MRVQLVCVLSALCADLGPIRAGATIWTGATGHSGGLTCPLLLSGNQKFLCREQCEEANVLIETANATSAAGRYHLQFTSDSGQGYVTIIFTQMSQSDAGKYRFGLGTSLRPDFYCDVEIRVADAPLNITDGFILTYRAGETALYPCDGAGSGSTSFLCKTSCDTQTNVLIDTSLGSAHNGRHSLVSSQGRLFAVITPAAVADGGRYLCGYGRPSNSVGSFLALVVDAAAVSTATQPDYLLPLVASWLLVAASVGVCVLLFYKWRQQRKLSQKASEPKANTNGVAVIYENHVASFYQNIDRAKREQDYATIKT